MHENYINLNEIEDYHMMGKLSLSGSATE